MSRHSPEPKAQRLLDLSEQVNRVAESLAQLALAPDIGGGEPASGAGEESLKHAVKSLIRARKERDRFIPSGLLGEPVWDLLLYLLDEELMQSDVSVASACRACGHPDHIGVRWLDVLVENGLAALSRPPAGGAEIVRLTRAASHDLRTYILELSERQ
jgi:hypothetical protein